MQTDNQTNNQRKIREFKNKLGARTLGARSGGSKNVTVLYRTIMKRSVIYEPQRPYTATKKLENLPTENKQRTNRQRIQKLRPL